MFAVFLTNFMLRDLLLYRLTCDDLEYQHLWTVAVRGRISSSTLLDRNVSRSGTDIEHISTGGSTRHISCVYLPKIPITLSSNVYPAEYSWTVFARPPDNTVYWRSESIRGSARLAHLLILSSVPARVAGIFAPFDSVWRGVLLFRLSQQLLNTVVGILEDRSFLGMSYNYKC